MCCRSVSVDSAPGLEADSEPLLQSRKLLGLDKIEALLSKKKTVIVVSPSCHCLMTQGSHSPNVETAHCHSSLDCFILHL